MTKWEYKEFSCSEHSEKAIKTLMEFGREGWELVNVNKRRGYDSNYMDYLLKRSDEDQYEKALSSIAV